MSKVYQFPPNATELKESQIEAACTWIIAIEKGLNDKEKSLLSVWFDESPNHMQTLLEVAELWDKFDKVKEAADIVRQIEPKASHAYVKWMATAAMVVLAVFFSLNLTQNEEQFSHQPPPLVNTYQTAVGEQKIIVLQDGSELTLNTNTIVEVFYSAEFRTIYLYQGELYSKVKPDNKRPFTVISKGVAAQAVGTAFNVNADASLDSVEILVIEGIVDTGGIYSDATDKSVNVVMEKRQRLTSDQEATFSVLNSEVKFTSLLTLDNSEDALGWRKGRLIFRQESLVNVITEINRYTSEKVLLTETELADIQITGVFKTGDLNSLLQVLSTNFNIEHSVNLNGDLLLRSNVADNNG